MIFTDPKGVEVGASDVPSVVEATGVALFRHATVAALRTHLSTWTRPYPHPHEDEPGLTLLGAGRARTGSGTAGFTRMALDLHTDRATRVDPPTLVAVLMVRPSSAGGEALLADAAPSVHEFAADSNFKTMCDAAFIASNGRRLPIVENAVPRRYRIRFRDDELARPCVSHPAARPLLDRIESLCRRPRRIALGPGEGYLIHNYRYLHGRQEFQGSRVVARFLAECDAPSLRGGFGVHA